MNYITFAFAGLMWQRGTYLPLSLSLWGAGHRRSLNRASKGLWSVYLQAFFKPFVMVLEYPVVAANTKPRGCGYLRPWSLRASCDFKGNRRYRLRLRSFLRPAGRKYLRFLQRNGSRARSRTSWPLRFLNASFVPLRSWFSFPGCPSTSCYKGGK